MMLILSQYVLSSVNYLSTSSSISEEYLKSSQAMSLQTYVSLISMQNISITYVNYTAAGTGISIEGNINSYIIITPEGEYAFNV